MAVVPDSLGTDTIRVIEGFETEGAGLWVLTFSPADPAERFSFLLPSGIRGIYHRWLTRGSIPQDGVGAGFESMCFCFPIILLSRDPP